MIPVPFSSRFRSLYNSLSDLFLAPGYKLPLPIREYSHMAANDLGVGLRMDLCAVGKGSQRSAVTLASPEGLRLAGRVSVLSNCLGGQSVGLGKIPLLSKLARSLTVDRKNKQSR